METSLAHLQINVAASNLPFYHDLMSFLGWSTVMEADHMSGYAGANGVSVWCIATPSSQMNDYDSPGVNHLGISAASVADVDAVAGYLQERGVALLFETPRARPEFVGSEDQIYYQVMFETPDRILVEVVYSGPKA